MSIGKERERESVLRRNLIWYPVSSLCRINPVIGCIQEEGPNPLEDMTDEQKEYEANRLVNMIDQLQRYKVDPSLSHSLC